jgi:hypothetical protein
MKCKCGGDAVSIVTSREGNEHPACSWHALLATILGWKQTKVHPTTHHGT